MKKSKKTAWQKEIEAALYRAILAGAQMLIEGGSERIGFSDDELRVMTEVIYDDLEQGDYLRKLEQK